MPLAISGKRVWRFDSVDALRDFQARLPAVAKARFVSKVDHDACFPASAKTTLLDGSRLYALDGPTADQLQCLAAKWQGKP